MIVYNVQNLPAEMVTTAATIRATKSVELRAAFDAALRSDVFMSFEEKVDGIFDALRIPISDDQSYNQFFIHSKKDLESEAGVAAARAQVIPTMPTLDQVHAEALKRYNEKAAKLLRQSERRATKAARSAGATPQVEAA